QVLPSTSASEATAKALTESHALYAKAAEYARAAERIDEGYARLNEMTVAAVLAFKTRQTPRLDESELESVRTSVNAWADKVPDFWPFAQLVEIEIYRALCKRALHPALPAIEVSLEDLWGRMKNPREWASVRDQARFTLRPYGATYPKELATHEKELEA